MPWSRLACRFAVLTVLVLHATCLETRSWGAEQVTHHAISNDAAAFQHAAQQALQGSLNQALQSLMPDAAAAAVLFNTAEAHQLAGNSDTVASMPEPRPAAVAAAAAITASEIIPMRTAHGLALPSKHRLQLRQSKPGLEASLRDAESAGVPTAPYDELQDEHQEDYVYLQELSPVYLLHNKDYQHADAAANADAEQAPLPPQLPEDAPSSSSSDDMAAANPGMLTLQGDIMISSRMPVSSVLLQQSIAQPLVELATDVARGVWQVLARVEAAASLQQLQQARPFRLQEVEVTVGSGSSSSSSSSSDLAHADSASDSSAKASSSSSSSSSSDKDAMEISVTVESSRPRPLLPFLQAVALNRKQAVAQDSLDAAAVAAAVLRALGRRGASEQQQQAESEVQQQQVQEMIAELQATGAYQGELQGSTKHLPAATAAAVAAAASTLSSSAEPWDSMEMELEVTHTIQSRAYTWGHAILLVLAMVCAHMGLCLLAAPWVAKLLGQEAAEDDSSSSSSSSDEKQAQFISAGLAEAGLYKKLLPEGAEV